MTLPFCPSIAAYQNERAMIVEPMSGCNGSYLADRNGKEQYLTPGVTDAELGQALLSAMAGSRYWGIEEFRQRYDFKTSAAQYEEWVSAMVSRYEYKSKAQFFRKLMRCNVKLDGDKLCYTPYKKEGSCGWSSLKELQFDIPAQSALEEIGKNLRLAFQRCE